MAGKGKKDKEAEGKKEGRKVKDSRTRRQTYHRAGPSRAGPRGGPGAGVEVAAVL